MSIHFFRCNACDQTFVGGQDTNSFKITCPSIKCEIKEISEEEANKIAEEKRNE